MNKQVLAVVGGAIALFTITIVAAFAFVGNDSGKSSPTGHTMGDGSTMPGGQMTTGQMGTNTTGDGSTMPGPAMGGHMMPGGETMTGPMGSETTPSGPSDGTGDGGMMGGQGGSG